MLPQTQIIALDSINALETQGIYPEGTGSGQIIRANRDPAPSS
jgi:hypothetical protein